jgi:hypothetical protein
LDCFKNACITFIKRDIEIAITKLVKKKIFDKDKSKDQYYQEEHSGLSILIDI